MQKTTLLIDRRLRSAIIQWINQTRCPIHVTMELIICVPYFLPTILLPSLLRSDLVHSLSQRSRFIPLVLVFLSVLITYAWILWFMVSFGAQQTSYRGPNNLNKMTSDYTLYELRVVWELWLRNILPFNLDGACFSANIVVCRLANVVGRLSIDQRAFLFVVSSIPTLLGLGWYELSNRRSHRIDLSSNS